MGIDFAGNRDFLIMAEEEKKENTNRTIMFCSCDHEFQDSKYGKKKRVHNRTGGFGKNARSTQGWRCTVCGSVKT